MTKKSLKRPVIVFDLDGTLIDTAPDLANTLNYILAATGRERVDEAEVRPWVGLGARHMLRKAIEKGGETVTPDQIERLFEDYLVHYAANIAVKSAPFPGLLASMERLRADGARFGICTNKREDLAILLLDALDLTKHFGVIVGNNTLPVAKPHPEPLLHAIGTLDGTPETAVMVGDSITDRDTARAAGVPVVLVSFGYTEIPAAAMEPDALIDHYDAFEDAVRSL